MNYIDKVYYPKTIIEKFPHITKRQIAYYAEQKIINPIIESSGRGTSRIYDFSGVLSIILALEIRAFLKKKELTVVIKAFQKKVKEGLPHRYISIAKNNKEVSFKIGSKALEPTQNINIVFNMDVILSGFK